MLFKLNIKMIGNRPKLVMTDIISPKKCSFVPLRHITNNVVVYQELIHSLKNKHGRKVLMVIMVDQENNGGDDVQMV